MQQILSADIVRHLIRVHQPLSVAARIEAEAEVALGETLSEQDDPHTALQDVTPELVLLLRSLAQDDAVIDDSMHQDIVQVLSRVDVLENSFAADDCSPLACLARSMCRGGAFLADRCSAMAVEYVEGCLIRVCQTHRQAARFWAGRVGTWQQWIESLPQRAVAWVASSRLLTPAQRLQLIESQESLLLHCLGRLLFASKAVLGCAAPEQVHWALGAGVLVALDAVGGADDPAVQHLRWVLKDGKAKEADGVAVLLSGGAPTNAPRTPPLQQETGQPATSTTPQRATVRLNPPDLARSIPPHTQAAAAYTVRCKCGLFEASTAAAFAQLAPPSLLRREWWRLLVLGAAVGVGARAVWGNWRHLRSTAASMVQSVRSFYCAHLEEPLAAMSAELLRSTSRRTDLGADALKDAKESMRNMLMQWLTAAGEAGRLPARPDGVAWDKAQLSSMAEALDMSLVSRRYEACLPAPITAALTADMVQVMLMQVQFIKVEALAQIEQMERILQQNHFNMQITATIPALVVGYVSYSAISAILARLSKYAPSLTVLTGIHVDEAEATGTLRVLLRGLHRILHQALARRNDAAYVDIASAAASMAGAPEPAASSRSLPSPAQALAAAAGEAAVVRLRRLLRLGAAQAAPVFSELPQPSTPPLSDEVGPSVTRSGRGSDERPALPRHLRAHTAEEGKQTATTPPPPASLPAYHPAAAAGQPSMAMAEAIISARDGRAAAASGHAAMGVIVHEGRAPAFPASMRGSRPQGAVVQPGLSTPPRLPEQPTGADSASTALSARGRTGSVASSTLSILSAPPAEHVPAPSMAASDMVRSALLRRDPVPHLPAQSLAERLRRDEVPPSGAVQEASGLRLPPAVDRSQASSPSPPQASKPPRRERGPQRPPGAFASGPSLFGVLTPLSLTHAVLSNALDPPPITPRGVEATHAMAAAAGSVLVGSDVASTHVPVGYATAAAQAARGGPSGPEVSATPDILHTFSGLTYLEVGQVAVALSEIARLLLLLKANGGSVTAEALGMLEDVQDAMAGPTPLQQRVCAVDRLLTTYDLTAPRRSAAGSAGVAGAIKAAVNGVL